MNKELVTQQCLSKCAYSPKTQCEDRAGDTIGGANENGNSEADKEFDALLINPKASESLANLLCGDFAGDASDAVI